MSDDNHTGVVLEELNSKMDFVVEAVGQIQDQVKILPTIKADLEGVKSDLRTIKSIVTEHEDRLIQVENSR